MTSNTEIRSIRTESQQAPTQQNIYTKTKSYRQLNNVMSVYEHKNNKHTHTHKRTEETQTKHTLHVDKKTRTRHNTNKHHIGAQKKQNSKRSIQPTSYIDIQSKTTHSTSLTQSIYIHQQRQQNQRIMYTQKQTATMKRH